MVDPKANIANGNTYSWRGQGNGSFDASFRTASHAFRHLVPAPHEPCYMRCMDSVSMLVRGKKGGKMVVIGAKKIRRMPSDLHG